MIVNSNQQYISQLKHIWKTIFNDSDGYIKLFFEQKYKHNETLLDVKDGRIRGMVFFPSYNIKVYDTVYKSGYLCGAATLPEYRGQGVMEGLMQESFRLMSVRGDTFSVLIPANTSLYGFYSRFGYKPLLKRGVKTYSKLCYTDEKSNIKLIEIDSPDRIMPIYESIISTHKVVVLQDFSTYNVAINIYKQYGKIYIIKELKTNLDIGYLFCEYYTDNRKLWVKEIMLTQNFLRETVKTLTNKFNPKTIVVEGLYRGLLPFETVSTVGMLKTLNGSSDLKFIEDGNPYINMMLD
ncbi:GNAT family N-acetyltransferase [bacterium]|nr:GNAT family N-acetyltransferase [bacterium]